MSFLRVTILTAAAAALASMLAMPASAVDLGYGQFLGTWSGNNYNKCGGGVDGGDCLETLLSGAYSGTEPFTSLGTGDNQLNDAGSTATGGATGHPLRMQYTGGGSTSGTWDYLSLAEAAALDGGPVPQPPGDELIDLYIVTKYGSFFSVFYYAAVDPLQADSNGLWSTNKNVLDDVFVGIDWCGSDFTDGDLCVGRTGNPPNGNGLSHISAYWPPLDGSDIPEPATMVLFGAGLAGLGLMRRRRRAA